MNYRHAYHAGNHGDVLKHLVLVRVLEYLRQKDTGFAALDAHAGRGVHDLLAPEALKTGEWEGGIGALWENPLSAPAARLAAPYFNVVHALNDGGALRRYPGSPLLMQRLTRHQDKLLFNELHPEDFEALKKNFADDKRVRVSRSDAAQFVKATLPFHLRRGLVLVDPAYEVVDEADRMLRLVRDALRRMANVVLMLWYPVITRELPEHLASGFRELKVSGVLQIELLVREPFKQGGLAGSGLFVFNPPWTLHDEMQVLMPELVLRLGTKKWGRGQVSWLTPPT